MAVVADIERPDMLFAAPGERQTLEDLISGVWEDVRTDRTAACPICRGRMTPRFGSGPAAVGGRCPDCGTELA